MYRPRIRAKLVSIDYILEILGCLIVVLSFVLPYFWKNALPAIMPEHYSVLGKPDSYHKTTIWLFPTIGLALFVGFTILNRFPFIFNYPVNVTEQNAEKLYRIGSRAIRSLKVLIVGLLLYLNYHAIRGGLNEPTVSPGLYLFLGLAVMLVGVTIYKIYK